MGMRNDKALWALALGPIIACTGVAGNGKVTRATRELAPFDQVELGGMLDVTLTQGTPQEVVIITDNNIQPLVTSHVAGSVLTIALQENVKPAVKVEIQAPHLTRFAISGAANAKLREIDGDALAIHVSGAANVQASGKVKRLSLDGSGAVDIDALKLVASAVDVDISGAGSAKVHADDALAVKLSGAGSVSYAGKPKVTQEISGVGSVKGL